MTDVPVAARGEYSRSQGWDKDTDLTVGEEVICSAIGHLIVGRWLCDG